MKTIYSSYFSIFSLVLCSLIFLAGCSSDKYEKRQLNKGELYYTKNISQDMVDSLCNYTNQCAIFNDEVHLARLIKTDSSYDLSLSVPSEMYNSEQYQSYAEVLAMQLSDDVFDKALVKIHLTDDKFNAKVTKSSRQD
jgi:hypothetical protein